MAFKSGTFIGNYREGSQNISGNRTKVDSIKAESQKSGIRRTLTE